MSRDRDNVVHVDFRRGRVLLDDPTDVQDEEVDDREPTKLEQFAGMIEHGLVLVTFDTRIPGVSVPDAFRGTPQLHLSFSPRFRLDDFQYDGDGIRATLSFDTGPHYCVIPWDSVYGMSSETLDERLVFRESFPPELLALLPALSDMGPDETP